MNCQSSSTQIDSFSFFLNLCSRMSSVIQSFLGPPVKMWKTGRALTKCACIARCLQVACPFTLALLFSIAFLSRNSYEIVKGKIPNLPDFNSGMCACRARLPGE